jgi:hypothetical protein
MIGQKEKMRLIHERGQDIPGAPKPIGYYVYLWVHNGVPCYVGKGMNPGRWRDHMKPNANDHNQLKYRYFRRFVSQMDCFITEAMIEADQCAFENAKIGEHGLRRERRAGTLVNDRNASALPSERGKGPKKENDWIYRLWRRVQKELRKEGRSVVPNIAPNTILYRTTRDNPKPKNTPGAKYINCCYPPYGETMTVAEVFAKGRKAGIKDRDQFEHITWDWPHGFIGFKRPVGEKIASGYIMPTMKLLREWVTENEWQKLNAQWRKLSG